jgi:Heavy-metal resistance
MFDKSKAWAITLLLAVAVVGLVAGAAIERWVASNHGGRQTYSGYLTHQLGLSPAQHDSVVAILHRHQPELHALFQTIRPQVDSARARVADEIRTILTPAQRETYQRLLDKDRAERARADSAAAAPAKKP